MKRKYYGYDTMFSSLKDGLTQLCKTLGIMYELSDGRTQYDTAMVWHFEIYANEHEANTINNWLDSVTIHERTV